MHFWCYRKQNWNKGSGGNGFPFCDGKILARTSAKKQVFCNRLQQVLSEVVASYMWEFKPRDISLSSPVPLVVTFCCLTQVLPVFPASLSIEHFDLIQKHSERFFNGHLWKMDTSLNKTPTVGPCRCSVIFFETLSMTDTSLDRTPRDSPRRSSVICFETLFMTDTSLDRTPRDGPSRSSVIFFVSL